MRIKGLKIDSTGCNSCVAYEDCLLRRALDLDVDVIYKIRNEENLYTIYDDGRVILGLCRNTKERAAQMVMFMNHPTLDVDFVLDKDGGEIAREYSELLSR